MIWILAAVLAVVVFIISMYNQIVHLEVKLEESKSGIDVALAKRYAVLTNMQESVKGYVKHESEVLEQVVQLRKGMSIHEMNQANGELNELHNRLIALVESYPDLKASDLFLDFQAAIVDCEEHLQAARRFYNSNAALFNEKILTFPGSLFAQAMKKSKQDYFASETSEREQIEVSF